jgi:hypothetical protein
MIKVFRHFRFLNQQKYSKYVIYAIGEILLVVIGILIALQVNNWNEDQKNRNTIHQLMMALEKDLEANVKEATRVINWHYERDSIIQLILDQNLTRDDYRQNGMYRDIYINFNYPFLKQEYLLKVLELESLGRKYNHLLPQIKLYKNLIDTERQMEQTIWDDVFNEIRKQENRSWFLLKTPEHWSDALDYYMKDPVFLNKVDIYRNNIIGNYNRRILTRRNVGVGILEALKGIHFQNPSKGYISNYGKHGLKPFIAVDCSLDEFRLDDKVGFRNSFLLTNEGTKPVSIYSLNTKGDRIDQIDLEPREFTTSYFIGLNNHRVGMGFELVKDNRCVGRYISVLDGYLKITD